VFGRGLSEASDLKTYIEVSAANAPMAHSRIATAFIISVFGDLFASRLKRSLDGERMDGARKPGLQRSRARSAWLFHGKSHSSCTQCFTKAACPGGTFVYGFRGKPLAPQRAFIAHDADPVLGKAGARSY
jgi:hypothetical protein